MVLLAVGILIFSVALFFCTHFSAKWQASSRRREIAGAKAKSTGVGDEGGECRPPPQKSRDIHLAVGAKAVPISTPTFKMEFEDEDATTPKATPTPDVPSMTVPELSLSSSGTGRNNISETTRPAAPKQTTDSPRTTSALMPPPSVRPSALRPLPKANGTSLMPPPSAASTLRVPSGRAASSGVTQNGRNLVVASTSTLPPASRPRKKIVLPPGHSPLDWAALTRNPPSSSFLRGEGVPPRMLKISPTQLRHYTGRKGKDAWGTYHGKVYNLTPYKDFHPGGVPELMRGAGRPGEAERLFNEIHPWVNWDGMLSECLVGVLVGEGEGEGEGEQGAPGYTNLDEMD